MVISIIGILVGLLLPAVNSAREAGRRAKCQSNMHNVVLAILGYVNNQKRFPPAGEFGEDTTTLASLTTCSTDPDRRSVIMSLDLPGGTAAPVGTPMYSWVVPILPYLDNQELYNQWTMFANEPAARQLPATVNYLDRIRQRRIRTATPGQASNYKIGNTTIGVLICPDDNTIQIGQGNLSYVVNGGFALYHAIPSAGLARTIDGGGSPTRRPTTWTTATGTGWPGTIGVTQKLGVMFLESTLPQGNHDADSLERQLVA